MSSGGGMWGFGYMSNTQDRPWTNAHKARALAHKAKALGVRDYKIWRGATDRTFHLSVVDANLTSCPTDHKFDAQLCVLPSLTI